MKLLLSNRDDIAAQPWKIRRRTASCDCHGEKENDMLRNRKTILPALLLGLSLFLVPCVALAQNDASQTNQSQLPPGSLSIIVPCNGGGTFLGRGVLIGIKVTFVVNLPSSGCPVKLSCPDIDPTGLQAFVSPRGEGPAIFGCGTGRMQLTGLAGAGTARIYIGGAD